MIKLKIQDDFMGSYLIRTNRCVYVDVSHYEIEHSNTCKEDSIWYTIRYAKDNITLLLDIL